MVKVGDNNVETGCYVADSYGQYSINAMLEFVADALLGTEFTKDIPLREDGSKYGTYADGGPWSGINGTDKDAEIIETISDLGDKAEQALNKATEYGFHWEWFDGNFILTEDEEDGL